MNNTNFGASHPRLFSNRVILNQVAAIRQLPATPRGNLPQAELRRIVADMID